MAKREVPIYDHKKKTVKVNVSKLKAKELKEIQNYIALGYTLIPVVEEPKFYLHQEEIKEFLKQEELKAYKDKFDSISKENVIKDGKQVYHKGGNTEMKKGFVGASAWFKKYAFPNYPKDKTPNPGALLDPPKKKEEYEEMLKKESNNETAEPNTESAE